MDTLLKHHSVGLVCQGEVCVEMRLHMPSYQYQQLQPGDIRILQIYPGRLDHPLHGSLRTFTIGEEPSYTAISYAWGEEVFPYKLYLSEGYLEITESLHGALRSLRDQYDIVEV